MKQNGFTALETIIVLGIVTLVIGITISLPIKSRQRMAEEHFWSSLRQEWRQAQVRALTKHQVTWISYNQNTNAIDFRWVAGKDYVSLPSTLKVKWFERFMITDTGYTRARTECFQSDIDQQLYLLKIQLAWGGYRIEKQSPASISHGR